MNTRKPFLLMIIAVILGMVISCEDHDLSNSSTDQNSTTYTVSFQANGGSPAPQRQTIKQGGKVNEPAYMTKNNDDSYGFGGDDGVWAAVTEGIYGSNSNIYGFGFAGWYTEAAFINLWDFDNDTVTSNITLYAKWDSNYHTVNFVANGGNPAPQQQNIAYGYKVIKPQNMNKEGCVFEGWYKDAAFINLWDFNNDTVTKNISLYAKWRYLLPPTTVYVEGTTLAGKLQWIASNAASNTIYILEVSSDEYLNPHTLSYSGRSYISIKLIGIGSVKTIELYGSGSLFTINNNVTLILDKNIVLEGSVNAEDGNLIMNDGSKITGGVSVRNGTFTMNGGEISGYTAHNYGMVYVSGIFTMNGGEILGNTYDYGRGVYVSGIFTMNGGEISGITANFSSSYYNYGGGGVYVDGTFTMTGGEISGNTANFSNYSDNYGGGGVYVSGTFTMTGGEISGNTANFPNYSDNYGGGGVYVDGTFTMTGGEISGNTANFSSSYYYYGGGGVYVSGTINKTGGIITGYSSNTVNGNVVKYGNSVVNNRGHAVYVPHHDSRFARRKETTAGQGNNLIYISNEPAPPTISGAWDE